MPNSNYRKGYNFERRVVADLECRGYLVLRQGKSKFPDLCALPPVLDGEPLLVECKYGKRPGLSKAEREAMLALKKYACCQLAVGRPRKPIEYEVL